MPALGLDRAQSGAARGAAERDRAQLDRLAGRAWSPGPLIGGAAYAISTSLPYEASAALYAVSLVCMLLIRPIPRGNAGESHPLRAVIEGLAYVRDNKIVLGAISLDLFAVLLGGATAMLPGLRPRHPPCRLGGARRAARRARRSAPR